MKILSLDIDEATDILYFRAGKYYDHDGYIFN